MAPRTSNRRKAECELEKPVTTQPKKSKIRISPVDCWNVVEQPKQQFQARSSQRTGWDIQGWIDDENGMKYPVFRLGVNFAKMKWRVCNGRDGTWAEDGQLVSPKTVPGLDQMNAAEYLLHQRSEADYVEADSVERLDPDTMSPFYPGILKAYGRRQVP
ncbi:hypothetical protein LTR36_001201 [Oleoguttula mirabilis]|uniref:Uncharacterized protein n=1 Tax=Oleoguttula mirabilis TaxID=1507867 RepID=A0AAV9J3H3_9PEZI|nr:hypothetical protein LTR36_001201 [Oleoguttula mirabilis]